MSARAGRQSSILCLRKAIAADDNPDFFEAAERLVVAF
jgi:hypothetical protein